MGRADPGNRKLDGMAARAAPRRTAFRFPVTRNFQALSTLRTRDQPPCEIIPMSPRKLTPINTVAMTAVVTGGTEEPASPLRNGLGLRQWPISRKFPRENPLSAF